ncbi:MAG: hypothetical protein SFX73_34690 [Kofleriaceae bacterium]|nr:hypothetical protein [Kofleriaceae bacterium]
MRSLIDLLLPAALLTVTTITGCGLSAEPEGDGEHDAIPTGKGDGSYEEGSWQAISVLRAANGASLEDLRRAVADGGAGLSRNAARSIVAFRAGADGALGTMDDRELDTLGQLDAVPYVGPLAFERLLDYAWEKELVVSSKFSCKDSAAPDAVIEGQWSNRDDEWDLQMVTTEDGIIRSQDCGQSIRQSSSTAIQFGCFIEPEWTFYEPSYALTFPSDVRTRTTPYSVKVVDITSDDRYVDGYREVADTERTLSCTPGTPGT